MEKKTELILFSAASSIILAMTLIFINRPIAQFSEMFDAFEADIPLVTRLILSTYHYWWIFPIVTLLLGAGIVVRKELSEKYATLLSRTFLGSVVFAGLLYLFVTAAMYYGVFSMEVKST